MTRPAIVIGLGGTGQRIVTFLKKELLEIGNGTLPADVKLLAFDTASRVEHAGTSDNDGVYKLGNVSLEDQTEYICIGADLSSVVKNILADQNVAAAGGQAEFEYLHWFPALEMTQAGLSQAAYNTTQGAGAYRNLGRLSLFENVYDVLAHLESAMEKLVPSVRGSRKAIQTQASTGNSRLVEIIVVGSLVGGTGAGTFVDMAWLIRAQAEKLLKDKYALRGFFLLPTTFGSGGVNESKDKPARGFAAWQELDRAMLSGGSGNKIVYNQKDVNLHISCDVPAYDITYLIDPARKKNPIHLLSPEEGIFPGVAHLISFLLDEESGRQYTENLINTIVNARIPLPKGVYHSSIGGYTLKVPVYYNRAKFSHDLALETLDALLAPQVGAQGVITHVSQIKNTEADQGTGGLVSVVKFLTSDRVGTIANTGLMQLVGRHKSQNAGENGAQINFISSGGVTTSLLPYFNGLNDVSEYNPETAQITTHSMTGELQWKIWQVCPPREKGEDPDTAYNRLTGEALVKSVPTIRRKRFGLDAANNTMRGEFGKELEDPKAAQVTRFKELLQAQLLVDLNGIDADPLKAKGGKLGYVRAFVKELSDTLLYFKNFLGSIRTVRSEILNLAQVTSNAAMGALNNYQNEKNKPCWVTFNDLNVHPDSDRALRNWLMAVQVDIDRRRGDILLDVLDETVASMRDYSIQTLKDIDDWIVRLAIGIPGDDLIKGLYTKVVESRNGAIMNHELDQRLGNPNFNDNPVLQNVSQVMPETVFIPTSDMISDALDHFKWQASPGKDGIKFDLEIDGKKLLRNGKEPDKENLKTLINLTEKPYQGVAIASSIAKEISSTYLTGDDLAKEIAFQAEPYYQLRGGSPNPIVQQAYLRVDDNQDATTVNYFDLQFKPRFLAINKAVGGGYNKSKSEDRYKLTLVRSDDLMPSQSFEQWHACFGPYKAQFTNLKPKEIHIFPAEQNAAYYQQNMPLVLTQAFRILRPEVVALLEDRQKIEWFFKAYSHGFISKMQDTENGITRDFWGYQLPMHPDPLYLTNPQIGGAATPIFQVIRNFLSGHDQRLNYQDLYAINWQQLNQESTKSEQVLSGGKKALYLGQTVHNPGTIISEILAEGTLTAGLPIPPNAHIQTATLRTFANQKFTDLADVGRFILTVAAG